MTNKKNLKSWQPGQSGNPSGKPKGTKNLSTWIRNLLEDENFVAELQDGKKFKGAPIEAIVKSLIIKALNGDIGAFNLLAKYGYGNKVDVTSKNEALNFNFSEGTSQYVRKLDPNMRLDQIPGQ